MSTNQKEMVVKSSEVKRRGAKLEHAPSLPVWARVQLAASSQEWVAALGMQNVSVSYP